MSTYKQKYDEDGFVIIPSLIQPDLLAELQDACVAVIARTRAGDWPHRRVVGKQFPPYGNVGSDPDSWGVQHVMHPDLEQSAFARYYTSSEMRAAASELLQCEDGHLQMGAYVGRCYMCLGTYEFPELFNLLINPTSHEFALSWHRDDVKAGASEDEEREALRLWHYGVSSFSLPVLSQVFLTSFMSQVQWNA
jgi:hypothetical protein